MLRETLLDFRRRGAPCAAEREIVALLVDAHRLLCRCSPRLAGLLMVMLALTARASSSQTWQEAVDYAKLQSRLGAALPIGAGGRVSLVEAPNGSGHYYIDVNNAEFTAPLDPSGVALDLFDGSGGGANGVTGHATNTVGANYFGNTLSMAPGANEVTIYEVNNWWAGVLNYGTNSAPVGQPFRVQNNSWVGSSNSTPNDQDILRRYDYVIETGDLTAVVAANNYQAAAPQHPNLMVHSYNAIVAGRSDGRHSRGQTNSVYGQGRFRPDLVAPATQVGGNTVISAATARISSAAALLHESGAGTEAVRSETMKAILLAGATKQEFAGFVDPITTAANPWDRTSSRPLDDLLGAGELNVYNSYLIQQGGKNAGSAAPPVAAVDNFGWDYQDRKSDAAVGDIYYNFQVAPGSHAPELSILLAWNAKVTDSNPSAEVFTPALQPLAPLDLRLYDSSTSFMGTLLDQSLSTVDNVEHIYQTNLGPGTYTLRVSGAANWDYGLAWRMSTLFDNPSADFDADGVVSGADFLVWQRNFGRLLSATAAQGDADGDGDVDHDDLAIFRSGVAAAAAAGGAAGGSAGPAGGASGVAPGGALVMGVPEPTAAGLAVTAGLLWGALAIRWRSPSRREL